MCHADPLQEELVPPPVNVVGRLCLVAVPLGIVSVAERHLPHEEVL